MKKFWLVLLSLGLVMAFSVSAFAVDVKFSGEFFVGGLYLDKTTLKKDTATDGPSTAFYYQRLRLTTQFVVSPGLTLNTRFDVMERAWGAARTTPGIVLDNRSSGTIAENENIAFDYLNVSYATPIGTFAAGYMQDSSWGTMFGNNYSPAAKLSWMLNAGGFLTLVQLVKGTENSVTAKNPAATAADADNDRAYVMSTYSFKQGKAGVLGVYYRNASTRPGVAPAGNYQGQYYTIDPFVIVTLGPVKLEAEAEYYGGKTKIYDNGVGDVTASYFSGYLDALVTLGPVYFGGTFAYLPGDDPATTDKVEGGRTGGNEWNPCLLLWNFDRYYWAGNMPGNGTSTNSNYMTNALFYQGRVGVKPTAKLDVMASVSYANTDRKPTGYVSDSYGWEVDLTGTYKITNNLSYMLGIGYLMTGDYFKATSAANNVTNNYILVNKLTLTF